MDKMTYEEIINIRDRIKYARAADFYDVLDKMGYPNQCLDIGIKPVSDNMRVSGPAFTLLGTREPRRNEELVNNEILIDCNFLNYLYPGCVIVCNGEMGHDVMVGSWGEMTSYGARNKGASGIIIDGGIRDKQGLLDIENWSAFVRYTSPVESDKRWRIKEIEVPIFMSGTLTRLVRVNPGDWIFGDMDGVIVVPKEILNETIVNVEDLAMREELSRKELAEGAQFIDVFKKYNRA